MSSFTHPDDAVLAQYAAGALRPGFDLVLAAHLERCPACRASVRRFESAAGALLCEAPEAELAGDALGRTLARLDQAPDIAQPTHVDRRPLADRLAVKKKRWLGPGSWVQSVETPVLNGDKVYFLRVAAGLRGIPHGHEGVEFTTILYGALTDDQVVHGPGSFIAKTAEVYHQPEVAKADGDCLCLIATHGRLVTRDMLSGMVKSWARV